MKSLIVFIGLFCLTQTVVAQSFIVDLNMKKMYGSPYIFTDSTTQNTYFVFIRKETFTQKASVCIVETDAEFKVLRQSETNCGEWDGSIVFQEINPTNLILYIVETRTIFKPALAKLQINRKTLTYYFDKVVSLELGDEFSYLRTFSDGKKHYVINVVRAAKTDSLLVLVIENGVSQGIQRYLLPDLSDINETWKKIFKDRFVMFGPRHPLLVINPTDNPTIFMGFTDNKLYLTNGQLVFTMKYDKIASKMERIVRIDCENRTITTDDITFRKPKAIEDYASNELTSTASFVTDDYLFQAWTNGKTGVLVARTVETLREKQRWEFGEQDTFGFKNSPVYSHRTNESYWFSDKKKPFKKSKELLTNMLYDGILLAGRKHGDAIEMQFGTYKYVNEMGKRIAMGVALGLTGVVIGEAAFPDYERATFFEFSLNANDLSPQKAFVSDAFDVSCERIKAIIGVKVLKYFLVDGRRAILYQKSKTDLLENDIVRYYLKMEWK